MRKEGLDLLIALEKIQWSSMLAIALEDAKVERKCRYSKE